MNGDNETKLPFWLSGLEIQKLVRAGESLWRDWLQNTERALRTARSVEKLARIAETNRPPAASPSPRTARKILEILAWERRIEKEPDESWIFFGKRLINAYDTLAESGGRAGLEKLLRFYGSPSFRIEERRPGRDWDMIFVDLDINGYQESDENIAEILDKYGRACRRYSLEGFETQQALETLVITDTQYHHSSLTIENGHDPNPSG